MKSLFAIALIVTAASGCLREPEPAPPATVSPSGSTSEPIAYPTFEIFQSSRMFHLLLEDSTGTDLSEAARMTETISSSISESVEEVDEFLDIDRSGRPSAELQPVLPATERPIYSLLPVVMMVLEPLWTTEHWTEAQVEFARNAALITGRISGAPKLVFQDGRDRENRAALEELVRWFQATTKKPECLAAMIFTMDFGPYVGMAYETSQLLEHTGTIALGVDCELRFARTDREPEPWVMQFVRGGKLQWSRVISGLPMGEVALAQFDEGVEAEPLGAYGWHVPFTVDWPSGLEQAHLYLDADGKLLFYFLSW